MLGKLFLTIIHIFNPIRLSPPQKGVHTELISLFCSFHFSDNHSSVILNLKAKSMISLKLGRNYHQSPFMLNSSKLQKEIRKHATFAPKKLVCTRKLAVKACSGQESKGEKERRSFLSLEEAGLVEMSGLSTHERFLCRLTISSLNLLRVISEQEGCPIEELNAGSVCDWFLKDKLKREQNMDSAVLQWNDSDYQI